MSNVKDANRPLEPVGVTAEAPATQIVLSAEQMKEILSTVLAEARKPYIDERAEQRRERDRMRIRAQQDEMRANDEARWENCTHLRSDNTSAIAWMNHSDDVWRGVCQHCNGRFAPEHPRYKELIRVPTRTTVVM